MAEEGAPQAKRARIAVVGAGWWSQVAHLPHLQRNLESDITAIVEPCPAPRSTLKKDMQTTEELATLYGVPVLSTVEEFLESAAAKETDGILICSSHASHHEIGMKVMKAGFHVMMEKPMATDPKEAHELALQASKSDKLFMVNNTANFRDSAKKVHDLIKEGKVGQIKHVQCYFGSPLLWLFDDPENVGWVKPSGTMLGNGFGWGQMSHTLAWAYLVTGLSPKSVMCQMVYSDKSGADLWDSAIVRCTNGATMSIQGVASLPFKSYSGSGKQIDNKIFGTEGMLTYSGNDKDSSSGSIVLTRHDGADQEIPGFDFENYELDSEGPESLKAFIAGCLGKPVFNAADASVALKAVQTIDAMYRSAKSGRAEDVC